MFRIAPGPTDEEVAEVLEIVRSYLSSRREEHVELTEEVRRRPSSAPVALATARGGHSGGSESGSLAAKGVEFEREDRQEPLVAMDQEQLAPAVTWFVTDGAAGIGVSKPAADPHVVGGSTVGSMLIVPNERQPNDNGKRCWERMMTAPVR
jgi:hypothetical protein